MTQKERVPEKVRSSNTSYPEHSEQAKTKPCLCIDMAGGKSKCCISKEFSPTLMTTHQGEPVICIEGNGSRPSHMGDGYAETETMFTLNSTEKHGVCYETDAFYISSFESNCMMSKNPYSGYGVAEQSRTLDLNGGNPACNQGGIVIVHGVDSYNQKLSGDISITMRAASANMDACPKVLIVTTGKKCIFMNDQGGERMDINYDVNSTIRASGQPPIVAIDGKGTYLGETVDTIVGDHDSSVSFHSKIIIYEKYEECNGV